MRRVILALSLYAVLGLLPGSSRPLSRANHSQAIATVPVPRVAAGLRIGALSLVEAWELRSPNTSFGGLSGMVLTGPRQFMMVSDAGQRVSFSLDNRGRVGSPKIEDLPPLNRLLARKRYLDAEAVTRDAGTGRTWIALEGIAQVWRFDAAGVRSSRRRNPAMFRWPANGGTESLARMPDRRFIAFSERQLKDGLHEGLMFAGDPSERRNPYFTFWYDPAGLGSVTDAAALPDGRILILHRKLGLSPIFTTSVAIADPRHITAGSTLKSHLIATISSSDLAENYEGLAIDEGPAGLSIWLVADDNQNDWQHSRLLHFTIDPVALRAAKKALSSPTRPS